MTLVLEQKSAEYHSSAHGHVEDCLASVLSSEATGQGREFYRSVLNEVQNDLAARYGGAFKEGEIQLSTTTEMV